jgi:serine/threonine protein kinase
MPKKKHPSHAVKRFLRNDPQAFEAEVSNLKRLKESDNPNLVKLLATYSYREHLYLIFEWADGNLLDFWREYQNPYGPVISQDWTLWFSKHCLGIAKGLQAIHSVWQQESKAGYGSAYQLHGRHGDVKPENILWFKDPSGVDGVPYKGVLKISDFGLTTFHTDNSKSAINAQEIGNSPTYRAPEYDVLRQVSQSYDIWTLGCVLLEFATWFLLGWNKLEQFSIDRTNEDHELMKEDKFFKLLQIDGTGGQGQIGANVKESVNKVITISHTLYASPIS